MSAPDLAALLDHAATLLRADEGRHQPAQFPMMVDGGEVLCVARLVWRLFDTGPRVVVADVAAGLTLCQSLPGRPFELAYQADDAGDCTGEPDTVPASLEPGALVAPVYLAHLVDRAADRLKAEGWHQSAAVTWWADGVPTAYTARIDWARHELAPRVIVFDGVSGGFVCQSLPGKLHQIDPRTYSIDPPPDVAAEHQRRQRTDRRSGAAAR